MNVFFLFFLFTLLFYFFQAKQWVETLSHLKSRTLCKRKWVFGTNSNFLIPISLQPDGVGLRYFKLTLFDLTELVVFNHKAIYFYVLRLKDIWPNFSVGIEIFCTLLSEKKLWRLALEIIFDFDFSEKMIFFKEYLPNLLLRSEKRLIIRYRWESGMLLFN